jgi:hypothetical protein
LGHELDLRVGTQPVCKTASETDRKSMKLPKTYIWPAIGLAAVAFSAWLLYGELRYTSLDDVWAGLSQSGRINGCWRRSAL